MSQKVAAIVVSHNSELTLERCIQGLTAQDYPLEMIILVDSGSSDQKFLLNLQNKYAIELLLSENLGFSRANNLGYEKITSDIDFAHDVCKTAAFYFNPLNEFAKRHVTNFFRHI